MNEAVVPDDPDVEKREMRLRQIIISGNSPFVGKKLRDSGIREDYDCMVVGLEEGKEMLTQPNPNHVFCKGDIVWVVGETDSLEKLVRC